MQILACLKSVLAAKASVTNVVGTRIYLGRVDQKAQAPNVLMELVEQGQDYTHSGPVGLFDAHIRITARSHTAQEASQLGDEISRALQDWSGQGQGCKVQLVEHFNTGGAFDSDNGVFTQTEEFTAYFTRLT